MFKNKLKISPPLFLVSLAEHPQILKRRALSAMISTLLPTIQMTKCIVARSVEFNGLNIMKSDKNSRFYEVSWRVNILCNG